MRRLEGLVLAALLTLGALGCAAPARGSIGIYAHRERSTGRIVVVGVQPGGGGARAGLEVGDEILEVDGVPVRTIGDGDFHALVRGELGTTVVVVVRRDGLRHRIEVPRIAGPAPSSGRSSSP
jgi:S1-C subfamily serine protease